MNSALQGCVLLGGGLHPLSAILLCQAHSLHLPVELIQPFINSKKKKKSVIRVAAVCDRENHQSTIINKLCFPSLLSVSNQTPVFGGYYYYYFIEIDTKRDLPLVCFPVFFTLLLAAMALVAGLLISFLLLLSVSDFPVIHFSCPGWKESSVFLCE